MLFFEFAVSHLPHSTSKLKDTLEPTGPTAHTTEKEEPARNKDYTYLDARAKTPAVNGYTPLATLIALTDKFAAGGAAPCRNRAGLPTGGGQGLAGRSKDEAAFITSIGLRRNYP